jgi:hypothetical protein
VIPGAVLSTPTVLEKENASEVAATADTPEDTGEEEEDIEVPAQLRDHPGKGSAYGSRSSWAQLNVRKTVV